jgi:hypothetical protein
VLTLILSVQLMVVLDATIVNIALPDIRTALHFSPTSLSWVMNAYSLAFGGLLLLGGRAGDLFGRRRNAFYKHSRLKQYLKDGRALRIETVINARRRPGLPASPAQPRQPASQGTCHQRPAVAG